MAPVFKATLLEEPLARLVAFVNVGNDRLKVELFFDLLVGKCEEPAAEALPVGAVVDVNRNFCRVCVSGVGGKVFQGAPAADLAIAVNYPEGVAVVKLGEPLFAVRNGNRLAFVGGNAGRNGLIKDVDDGF